MFLDLNFNDKCFKDNILNLPSGVKNVNITGDIDIFLLCDILENVNEKVNIICNCKEEINKEFFKRGTFQGFNRSILNMVRKICLENVGVNDYVVDMTVGNGNDTLFLAKIAKKVFGFDIQEVAINNTYNLLEENNIENYELFNISHDKVNEVLKEYKKKIKLVLFNLGYLPGNNKIIMTNHKTTLKAIVNSFELLDNNGLILVVFYPHDEGKLEAMVVLNYLDSNNIKYKIFRNTLNENAPYLVVIN